MSALVSSSVHLCTRKSVLGTYYARKVTVLGIYVHPCGNMLYTFYQSFKVGQIHEGVFLGTERSYESTDCF